MLILMNSPYNEHNSVIATTFIRTLKSKTYKKMTAKDSSFFLHYLDELV